MSNYWVQIFVLACHELIPAMKKTVTPRNENTIVSDEKKILERMKVQMIGPLKIKELETT